MKLPEEAIKEFQEIYKKEYGEEIPYEEAADSARRLIGLVKLVYDGHQEDCRREQKLKEFPKGFLLDDAYSCSICGQTTRKNEAWYDKYGIKCLICQKGINRKEIPPSLAKHKDSWYSKLDMEMRFNLKTPTLRKWIRDGILKARSITNDEGRIHVQLFLVKDNKGFLPPKKLTESHCVQENRDGGRWIHSEPWYRFVDPFEHLKGYKIMDYLQWVESDKKDSCKNQK